MVTILHGEDISASRKALPDEAIKINGRDVSPETFMQLAEGKSLFGEKTTYVIENPKSLPEAIRNNADLILWFDHKLTPNQLKDYPGAKVQEFKLSRVVFQFVDSLYPKNQKQILSLFREYCRQEYPEIIFTMIVRQFRLMLDPEQLPPWQKNKILAQAKKFGGEKLRKIYQELLSIDYTQKSGQAATDLIGALELFLFSL